MRAVCWMGMVLFFLILPAAFFTAPQAGYAAGEEYPSGAEPGTEQTGPASVPPEWQKATQEQERKPKSYTQGPLDVHRSPVTCKYCHGEGTPSAANLLAGGRDIPLCRTCHPTSVYNLHVVGVRPSKVHVPPEFPLVNGEITCMTCHDEPSYNSRERPSWARPFFLRGTETGFMFCFSCHPKQGYVAYNPHASEHLRSDETRRTNCLFCHTGILPAEARRGLAFAALKGQPNDLCWACHLVDPHVGASSHLNANPQDFHPWMEEAARAGGPLLPLGDNLVPLCVSCHDPHIPGLIPHQEQGPDLWIEGLGDSPLRQQYRTEVLQPEVRERIAGLESKYARFLIVRDHGVFREEGKRLLRKDLQKDGSLCLFCHDVFAEGVTDDQGHSLGYRMLH